MPVPINVRECKREGTMRKGQSRETGNKVYTRYKKLQKKTKTKTKPHIAIWFGHHYAQTNTNNVNKTCDQAWEVMCHVCIISNVILFSLSTIF